MPPPPARLLDLTRLVSRLGAGPLTGVDRVELAYLDRLLAGPLPFFALVATSLGHVLLDRDGAAGLMARARGRVPLGQPDLLASLRRQGAPRARAEADLRRLALARAPAPLLAAMLRRHLPQGTAYLNVGHSNLAPALLKTLRGALGARIAVLLHDTIPLDYPEFTRPDTTAAFARKLAVVATADLVIFTTEDARTRATPHLAALGRVPPAVVAALGVVSPAPAPALLPPALHPAHPFFMTVGTIEPRKNHALLLQIWARMQATRPEAAMPHLHVIGRRGWMNADVFATLDTAAFMNRTVFEHADMADGAVAAMMGRAVALLFPSLAEGFGLPPVEAAAQGLPVVCAPLPVFREILGDYPVYLNPADSYSWMERIDELLQADGPGRRKTARAAPTWDDHFNRVLGLI